MTGPRTDVDGKCPMCRSALAPDGGCTRCSYGPAGSDEVRLCPACGEECDRAEGVCLCADNCPIPAAASNR